MVLRGLLVAILFLLGGCDSGKNEGAITFGTSADYRPFEYYEDGEMVGFEIDLAKAIAEKLGKQAEFKDMSFQAILTELQNGSVDVAVASMSPTKERRKNYDFTVVYHKSGVSLVYKRGDSRPDIVSDLSGVKVACQLGSVPEKWMKENKPAANVVSIDHVTQGCEFLKAGHVVGIVVDSTAAISLCADNQAFEYVVMAELDDDDGGCAMAVKKGSQLKQQIDDAIQKLQDSGELQALKSKWNIGSA
ncbi:MAG: ABC transporter substrate-binding protein [Holosporales bacterium]|jgi:polar amino acid transport system substrate-binding protein|nr:ABC transporter substrate-binding protein [Holosporales bacterium]